MVQIKKITWDDVYAKAGASAAKYYASDFDQRSDSDIVLVYGVPRGGIYAAQAFIFSLNINLQGIGVEIKLTSNVDEADVIVDDLIDSGRTREKYKTKINEGVPFITLFKKETTHWLQFPWEVSNEEQGPEENVIRMLEYIGEDPKREGLVETPKRVVKSWGELYSGYDKDPKDILKVFEDGACDEMVLLKNVEFVSSCEHHAIPFMGVAHIGYIPDGKVIGVSKLARLLEIYTRRLQIQERIGQQVTEVLMRELKPKGCGCVLEAKHLCMVARGVEKQHSEMITSSMRGNFKSDVQVRQEFLSLIGK